MAVATIKDADMQGLPISATHVLSSGSTDAMVANGSAIQKDTVRNILLAWALTIPVFVTVEAVLFGASQFLVLRVVGMH